jgi:AcrR family transcriptional regulator
MPYPTQTDLDQIVQTAVEMVETAGVEHLSLHGLAKALGIRAPSLYRYISGKDELLKLINTRTTADLFAAIDAALAEAAQPPEEQLMAVSKAYRTFALAHPRRYNMTMNNAKDELRPEEDDLLHLALPLQALMAQLSGETASLPALRGALALLHGFVMLEITKQLRRGGDLEEAFNLSMRAYLRGWSMR